MYSPDNEKPFPIRVYSKAELAMLYCPHQCIDRALENFYRWLLLNKPLMAELTAVGYNKYRRTYLPREVELIVKYIGEPGS